MDGRWLEFTEEPRVFNAVKFFTLILCIASLAGCEYLTGNKKVPPPPLEYSISSPYRRVHTIAIAPAINLSGSRDFDVLAVSDSLYAEMQQVQGINVLPLNKTLMGMRRLGIHGIDDPRQAQELAALLGADGLVIPAVTAYDPYNPPTVGMTLQMYTPPKNSGGPDWGKKQPVSQVQAVFSASNQTVLRELRDYAAGRTQYDSALLDQKFLMDIDAYMRFVCHAMIRRLMEVESRRPDDR